MKTKTSKDILLELDLIEPDLRALNSNYENALDLRLGLRAVAVCQCSNWKGNSIPHNRNQQVTQLIDYQQSDHIQKLTAIEAIIAAMEASPELVKARDVVKPLLAELEAAEEAKKEDARLKQAAKAKMDLEKKNAIAKALAKIEERFSNTLT